MRVKEDRQKVEHELRTDQISIPNVLRIHYVHFLVDISEFISFGKDTYQNDFVVTHKTTNNFDARIIHTFFSEVKIFVKLDFPR